MNATRSDSIYYLMGIGIIVLWLFLTVAPATHKDNIPQKENVQTELTDVFSSSALPPHIIFVFYVAVIGGVGLGLITNFLLLVNKLVVKEKTLLRGVNLVPWTLSDIARMTVLFLFIFTVIHAVLYVCVTSSIISGRLISMGGLVVGTLGVYLIMACGMYRSLIKKYSLSVTSIGLSLHSWFGNALTGIVAYIAFVPVFLLLVVVSYVICGYFGISPQPHELVKIFSVEKSAYKIIYLVLVATVFAPLYEEIVFRGFIYTVLRKYLGVTQSLCMSAIIFGAIHFNMSQFIPVMGLGIILAYLYERTGTLIAPIVFHMLNNTVAILLTFLILKNM
ncbi:MAG: CPBP family intramembrane metalloprotease [Candidatus Ancaeobacter aquaticus]|nr:CPBP family intramembrane metalloprotease [Candidatus Ancaeobacter aquaticus]